MSVSTGWAPGNAPSATRRPVLSPGRSGPPARRGRRSLCLQVAALGASSSAVYFFLLGSLGAKPLPIRRHYCYLPAPRPSAGLNGRRGNGIVAADSEGPSWSTPSWRSRCFLSCSSSCCATSSSRRPYAGPPPDGSTCPTAVGLVARLLELRWVRSLSSIRRRREAAVGRCRFRLGGVVRQRDVGAAPSASWRQRVPSQRELARVHPVCRCTGCNASSRVALLLGVHSGSSAARLCETLATRRKEPSVRRPARHDA